MSESEVEKMKSYYQENLKPDEYHKLFQEVLKGPADLFTHSLTALHQFFKSGKFKGNKLLEIGSGATVHNIASASRQFTEIVQSDFVEANCEELRKWVKGKSKLDWSHFLETVAKIEGYEDLNSGRQEIEARIRKSVKDVVHCDVLADQVVPPEVTTEYDVLLTSLTLEAAATSFDSFVEVLKRMNRLLRPGGGLVMIGFTNGAKWKTEGGEFHYLRLNKEDVDRALDMAGFAEKEWTIFPKTIEDPQYEYDNYYFLASAKI